MAVKRVWVLSIPVSDQERSKAFYRDALGFEVVQEAQMGPGMRWVQLGVPNTEFTVTLTTWFDQMPPGSLQGLVLEVDDIDATARDLHAKGYLADATVDTQPWGRFVILRDPDENAIVLQVPPAP